MKKIALIIPNYDNNWIGGINYYCNLLSQCRRYESESVEIAIITSPESKEKIQEIFPSDTTVLTSSLVKRLSLGWLVRNAIYVLTGRDYLMESFLLKHRLDVVSHSTCRNYGKRIKLIGWIPDLQHKYLPHFFTKKEFIGRERDYQAMINRCDRIVLSSHVAMNDVLRFYQAPKDKLSVMHFYKEPMVSEDLISKQNVQKKYHLSDHFFFLPNQFWAHKNHSIVIEALHFLKLKNKHVHIVCSGNTDDYRNPDHFKKMMARVDYLDLRDNFSVLGLIPMRDVNALIRDSIALINPSLFEGWSTTVEEARTYGKRIILSDIPVHREQSPPGALFFKPNSAEQLADCIENISDSYNQEEEEKRRDNAQKMASELCADFARQYVSIVKSIV